MSHGGWGVGQKSLKKCHVLSEWPLSKLVQVKFALDVSSSFVGRSIAKSPIKKQKLTINQADDILSERPRK